MPDSANTPDISAILQRQPRAIAKALRHIDDRTAERRGLLKALHPHAQKTHVIGLTGSPGAGKSTVVDALISHYREQGRTVGVVCVDPSSPFSGGAILGDRIRMHRHVLDSGVFIRSLATRGALGGLSRSAADSATVLGAAGYDVVLIETVGVGQDEIDVCRVAQSVVVVLTPGMGDDVQAIKAGILEIADVFLINKADRDGASKVRTDLRAMMSLVGAHERTDPPILESVATERRGIKELAEALALHRQFLNETPEGQQREKARRREAFRLACKDELLDRFMQSLERQLTAAANAVEAGAAPQEQIEKLIGEFRHEVAT